MLCCRSYVEFPWTVAKRHGFFPRVRYVECLPHRGRHVHASSVSTTSSSSSSSTASASSSSSVHILEPEDPSSESVVFGDYAQTVQELAVHRSIHKFLQKLDSSLRVRLNIADTKGHTRIIFSFLRQFSVQNFVQAVGLSQESEVRAYLHPERVVNTLLSFLQHHERRSDHDRDKLPSSPIRKRSVLIFAANCAHADAIVQRLVQRGESAVAAHSKIAPMQQASAFHRFCRGRLRFFVSVNMLNEGFDVPRVDCVVMARLTDRFFVASILTSIF